MNHDAFRNCIQMGIPAAAAALAGVLAAAGIAQAADGFAGAVLPAGGGYFRRPATAQFLGERPQLQDVAGLMALLDMSFSGRIFSQAGKPAWQETQNGA
jgi:hypothetical protein